jgi:hypothetical protein
MRSFWIALTIACFSAASAVPSSVAMELLTFSSPAGGPSANGDKLEKPKHNHQRRGCEKDLKTKNCVPPKTPTIDNTAPTNAPNTATTNPTVDKKWDVIQEKQW